MPRKKVLSFQILRVQERHKKDKTLIALQATSLDNLRKPNDAPDGTFVSYLDALILPKRRRGVKFRVTYTQIFQKEL